MKVGGRGKEVGAGGVDGWEGRENVKVDGRGKEVGAGGVDGWMG